ncbi:unnamed protein product [Lactuca virosa]|uniref:Regulator of MON1-CCZ1 complex N-terminal domain-containing protein n=1 Tax=Lactuca virosa TaxID=75947 RepID=A0AAU9NVL6_9ASTR|nr:unnamed protein product [Lactuca virosa]
MMMEKKLISSGSKQVVSWKTSLYTPQFASTTDTISEGSVLSIRYSLHLKLIVVQRSKNEIVIVFVKTRLRLELRFGVGPVM